MNFFKNIISTFLIFIISLVAFILNIPTLLIWISGYLYQLSNRLQCWSAGHLYDIPNSFMIVDVKDIPCVLCGRKANKKDWPKLENERNAWATRLIAIANQVKGLQEDNIITSELEKLTNA